MIHDIARLCINVPWDRESSGHYVAFVLGFLHILEYTKPKQYSLQLSNQQKKTNLFISISYIVLVKLFVIITFIARM